MVNCSILGCKNRSEQKHENVTFHTFPKGDTLRKAWLAATGRQDWEPTKYTRVCSRHFETRCFSLKTYKKYLHAFSVPTLFVNNSTPVDENDENLSVEIHSIYTEADVEKITCD